MSFRNLTSNRTRSVLTISSISISFAIITFLLSFGYGIEKMTNDAISSPDTLYTFEVSLDNSDLTSINDKSLADIRNLDNVSKTEPSITLPGRVYNGSIKADMAIKGYTKEYLTLAEIKTAQGEKFKTDNMKGLLISSGSAALLNMSKDSIDNRALSIDVVADKAFSPALEDGQIETIKNLKITGIVDDDKTPFVIVPMETLKGGLNIVNYDTARVKVKDKDQLLETRRQVEKMGLTTSFIGDTLKQINSFFTIIRYIIGGFGLTAMVVAIIGMFNILTISLLEKTQEIGILKSNGAKRKDVLGLFISEALIISCAGGILGIIAGALTSEVVNIIFNIYAQRSGGYAVDLFHFPLLFVLFMLLTAVTIGFLTGLYPARRASKLKILDAIKYE